MRDSAGERWLTITEAIAETGMSRSTIKGWMRDGLEHQLVAGKQWLPQTPLFARLRLSLSDTRVKTRWSNKQRD